LPHIIIGDKQCLEQAYWLQKNNKVDLEELNDGQKKGKASVFQEIKKRVGTQ
jgi:hypothetical protein